MLGENQVKRLLKHCEKIEVEYDKLAPCDVSNAEYFNSMRNEGWCEALRLVLEKNTHPISNKPIDDKECLSNCCGEPFGPPGWPDCDICGECGEHADCEEDDD